jgi:hypothetical protein
MKAEVRGVVEVRGLWTPLQHPPWVGVRKPHCHTAHRETKWGLRLRGYKGGPSGLRASVEAVPVAVLRVVLQLCTHTLNTVQQHGRTVVPVCKAGCKLVCSLHPGTHMARSKGAPPNW